MRQLEAHSTANVVYDVCLLAPSTQAIETTRRGRSTTDLILLSCTGTHTRSPHAVDRMPPALTGSYSFLAFVWDSLGPGLGSQELTWRSMRAQRAEFSYMRPTLPPTCCVPPCYLHPGDRDHSPWVTHYKLDPALMYSNRHALAAPGR